MPRLLGSKTDCARLAVFQLCLLKTQEDGIVKIMNCFREYIVYRTKTKYLSNLNIRTAMRMRSQRPHDIDCPTCFVASSSTNSPAYA